MRWKYGIIKHTQNYLEYPGIQRETDFSLCLSHCSLVFPNTLGCSCSITVLCSILCDCNIRLLCPSLSPRVCSNSCTRSQWCYLITLSSATSSPFTFNLSQDRVFSNELVLASKPKYWSFSFSISPSNNYSEVISFRIDWLDLSCCPRDSQKSSSAPKFKSINSLVLSLLYGLNSHFHTWIPEKP